jgi:hypothetical protein
MYVYVACVPECCGSVCCASQLSAYQHEIATHHVTRHNTPIHNILSTAPRLSISQQALRILPKRILPKDGNVMPKHVGSTIHN